MRADLASFPRVVMVAVMTFTESMKRTGQPLPSPTVCGHGSVGENRKKSGKIRSRSWLVCVTTSPNFAELRRTSGVCSEWRASDVWICWPVLWRVVAW